MGSAIRLIGLVGAATIVLSACGTGDDQEVASTGTQIIDDLAQEARALGYQDVYRILEDGQVTTSEYEDALDRFLSCMVAGGARRQDPQLNRVDSLTYIVGADALGLGDVAANDLFFDCRDKHFSSVEEAYVLTHEPVMDEALRVGSIECLQAAGFEVSGSEKNIRELMDAVGASREEDVISCVRTTARLLYPEEIISITS